MLKTPISGREEWLQKAVEFFRPVFKSAGQECPPVRVSTGWPSKAALSAKSRRIGECWDPEAAEDKVHHIFISPCLTETGEACGALAVLVHEMVHAAVGLKAKHGKAFKACALKVGLEGKMTSTIAGERLMGDIKACLEKLGPYPHAKLDLTKSPTKKQGTRMLKCECETCGFAVRTTKKWLEEVGAPHCPKHGAMFHEPLEGKDDSDEKEEGGWEDDD